MDTVVIMGVSGSGKTTVARGLAARMGWLFAEGDEFHPPANVEKMSAGIPLTDEDRWPWLRIVADWIGAQEAAGRPAAVTCSALKREYRDLLREGHPSVRFCHVTAPAGKIHDRMEHRRDHYMPASLLTSQLDTLEPLQPDEPGVTVPGDGSPQAVLDAVVRALGLTPPAEHPTP